MGTVALATRMLLAAIFATAAITKLPDPAATRATFEGFGMGGRLARMGGIGLAPAELVVAAGLILVPTARWSAVGAMLLLIAFIAGITTALRRGRRPDCGCFGALRPAPIGASTLVRNAVLLAAAVFVVVFAPGPSVDGWVGGHTPAQVISMCAAIAVALAAVLYLPSMLDRARTTAPGGPSPLTIGTQGPDFALIDTHGGERNLGSLLTSDVPLVLVFGSATCAPCVRLFPHLARWQSSLAERVRITLIVGGDHDAARSIEHQHGIAGVLPDPRSDVSRAYGMAASPSAFCLTPEGTVANGPAVGPDAIEELLRLTLQRLGPIPTPCMQTTTAA